jgi:hypothetical protein
LSAISKEAQFCDDFKKVQSSCVKQKEKKFCRKSDKEKENLAKKIFWEKSLGSSWRKSYESP